MKCIIKLAIAASLAASVSAQPHNHGHRHMHVKKASPVDAREVVTVYETPTAVAYELAGEQIDPADAEAGIAAGIYLVAGESTPTFAAPVAPSSTLVTSLTSYSTSAPAATPLASDAAFFEVKAKPKVSSTYSAEPTTTATTEAPAATSDSSSSGATGVDADFPDGEIDCDTLPTDYGAVPVDQLDLGGWAGILDVGSWIVGILIETFSEPLSGGPSPGMFATYDCPAGYDMAQWPVSSQGATGQSIGGLYCGIDNKLYLTRSEVTKKLCMKGAGGVYIVNKLSEKVSLCKTAYPGKEDMVLPTVVGGGDTTELYNPLQADSYTWQGSSTSAQYYVNPKGLDKDVACVWTSPAPHALDAGNWAGVNLGTSMDDDKITYLSIFPNLPTSTAALDYNIEITGDISGSCSYDYQTNSYSSGENGCTVASKDGGSIYVTFSN